MQFKDSVSELWNFRQDLGEDCMFLCCINEMQMKKHHINSCVSNLSIFIKVKARTIKDIFKILIS